MSTKSLSAIDIAILVPEAVAHRAKTLNALLGRDQPEALRFDATHHPHITLAQQFVEGARLDELYTELDRVLRHEPPLLLRIPGLTSDHGTVFMAVDAHPDLLRLHEQLMDVIEPFESPQGSGEAFDRDGEAIRPQDVDWVRSFREQSAYLHYRPHVTLGHGPQPPDISPIDFSADRIAVCRLGRYCTCRTILHEWRLGR